MILLAHVTPAVLRGPTSFGPIRPVPCTPPSGPDPAGWLHLFRRLIEPSVTLGDDSVWWMRGVLKSARSVRVPRGVESLTLPGDSRQLKRWKSSLLKTSANINMCIYSRQAFYGVFDIGILKTEPGEIFRKNNSRCQEHSSCSPD